MRLTTALNWMEEQDRRSRQVVAQSWRRLSAALGLQDRRLWWRVSAWFAKQDRRFWRRVAALLTVVSFAMIAGAGWLFAYPFYTDARAQDIQDGLRAQFGSAGARNAYAAGGISEGEPLTRIVVPKMDLDAVVVQGTSQKALNAGMGHYVQTPLPGEEGNVAIAGHSAMNGKAFAKLDALRAGDRIELITPLAHHVYEVTPPFGRHDNPWVVAPNDWSVISSAPGKWLTLTTCHPRGSAKERMVVRAVWVSTKAVG